MRKQYFFLPSEKGYHAWDVERLTELTRDFPIISVKLSYISEVDENFWYQGKNDLPTVRSMVEHFQLIRETDLEYPIILSANGRVMDGMHRVAKALMLGHDKIHAVQFKEDPPPDFSDVYPNELSYD